MLNRKIIYTLLLVLYSLASYTQIYEDKEAVLSQKKTRATFKTNPFAMLVGPVILTAEYRLSYETVLSENQSLQIGGSLLGKSFYLKMIEENDSAYKANNIRFVVSGYRFQLTYKYFPGDIDTAPAGWYIAPHFSYSSAKFTTQQLNLYDEYIKAIYVNYNLIIGYQILISEKLALDMFCGLGYRDNGWHEHYNQTNYPLDASEFMLYNGHLKLILGFNAGVAF